MASGSASPEDLDNAEFKMEGGGEHGSIKNSAINADPEFIIRFIHRVKQFPLLYNQDHEHFRNTNLKQQAWKQIAEEFGQTERWCIRKWVSLRDYFVKRKKRLRLGKPLRPWIYYNELSFLNVIYGHDQLDYYPNEQEEEGTSYIYYEDGDQSYGDASYDQDGAQYEVMDMEGQLDDEAEEYEYVQPVVEYGEEEQEKASPGPRVLQIHSAPTASAIYLQQQQQQRRLPPVLPRSSTGGGGGGNKAGNNAKSTNQGQSSDTRGPPPLSSFNSLNQNQNNNSSSNSLLRDHLSQSQQQSQQQASKPPPLKREGGLQLPPLRRAQPTPPSILNPQVKRTNGTSANYANSSNSNPTNSGRNSGFVQQQQNNAKRPKLQAENSRIVKVKEEVSFDWADADSAGSSSSNSQDLLASEQYEVPVPMPKRNGHDPGSSQAVKTKNLNQNPTQAQSSSNSTSNPTKKLDKPQFATDPYDLFCLSIAGQLRKMPREKAMLMQIEIMNLIYNSEFSQGEDGA